MLKLARQDLERSDITPGEADTAAIFSVREASSVYPDFAPLPALVIPYIDPWTGAEMTFQRDGVALPFCRVRYLGELPSQRGFVKRKPKRYDQPAKSGVKVYFPHVAAFSWREVLDDPHLPICITEGEKKALRGCLAGVPTIGLGGVYNFTGDDGELVGVLDRIEWKRRPVYICYDSDASENPDIQAAEGRLAMALGMRRRAQIYLVRLQPAPNGGKQGIDDLIAAEGEAAWTDALEHGRPFSRLHSAVLSLNEHVAWIEKESRVLDLKTGALLDKSNFVKGSKYSALKIPVPKQKGDGMKELSVADHWLHHENAQRYDAMVFDPSTDARVTRLAHGGVALNLWQGLPEGVSGDVQPFIDLTEYLCSEVDPEHRDFLIKLMAYKFQNPAIKVPICPVLIGTEGSGKSFWAKLVMEAAGQYGKRIESSTLLGDYNGWAERTLVAVIDEAKESDLRAVGGRLRLLISEDILQLNEKYRVAQQVKTYMQFVITSNERGVGAFNHDNRRMFVIGCPPKREDAWYTDYLGDFYRNKGPERVREFLLSYDLKGWKPPTAAPMTSEKWLSYSESLTPVERVAQQTLHADHGVVVQWMEQAMAWAMENETSPNTSHARAAREISDAVSSMQVRPWYTAEELAMLLPALVWDLQGKRNVPSTTPAGYISRALRQHGVRYLRNADDPKGFRWRGNIHTFLVIADVEEWEAPIGQAEFERKMRSFPRLSQYMADRRK